MDIEILTEEINQDELPSCKKGIHDVWCVEQDNCDNCGWNPVVSLNRCYDNYGADAIVSLTLKSKDRKKGK